MFRIKIIDRYIFKELLDPFLFGLISFSLILSASMVLFELVRAVVISGMPLITALKVFLYRLPGVAVYIFPMATLLAALLGFSRLSKDSEIIAFKAGGVSLFRLMVPVIVLGLMISVVTFYFYEIVVPESNRAAKNLLIMTTAESGPKIEENVFIPEFDNGVLQRVLYARNIKGDEMQGVIVQEFDDGRLSQIINAAGARWLKEQNSWLFKNGTIYLLNPDGEYRHLVKFDEQILAIKFTPADFFTGDISPEEMNISQLKKFIESKEKMGAKTTDLNIQLNLKIAIPFASLVFALLGAPLGLSPRRSASSIGLGVSILVIFVYYVLMFISMAFGEMQLLSPPAAAWMPNVLTGGIGVYIIWRAAQT
ncbi:MAG: LptF/LptG family permease [Candidatus Margulisiibacteriota bacterium]